MPKQWEKVTDRFLAESEDGERFVLLVYTTMRDANEFQVSDATPIEGKKRICTSSGQACNKINDDTFVIGALGLEVRRI